MSHNHPSNFIGVSFDLLIVLKLILFHIEMRDRDPAVLFLSKVRNQDYCFMVEFEVQ